jgi:hypothetical protein
MAMRGSGEWFSELSNRVRQIRFGSIARAARILHLPASRELVLVRSQSCAGMVSKCLPTP